MNNASAKTHPSITSSARKNRIFNMFQKINESQVLSNIPFRLDPSLEFSEDEEDDDISASPKQNDVKESGLICASNTPKPPKSHHRSCSEYKDDQQLHPLNLKSITEKKRYPLKEYKMTVSSFSTGDIHARKPLLQIKFPERNQNKLPHFQQNKLVTGAHSMKNFSSIPEHKVLKENIFSTENYADKSKYNKPTISHDRLILRPSDQIVTVNGTPYTILSKLGTGGSCEVFAVLEHKTKAVRAIKRVNLKKASSEIDMPSVREGYKKEIEYLKKLQDSERVIKMFDFEYKDDELLLVLEKGDTDLARFISNEIRMKSLSPLMIKYYWSQMLQAVAVIHKYGIVHSDLKPANFLLVEGKLKLIDFGIATSVPTDMTSAIRESQVGTLNYMAPEAITGYSESKDPVNRKYIFKIGVKSDVWSLGCILYNLVYGHTPFQHIRSQWQKIRAITDPSHEISFPPLDNLALLDVLKSCLIRDPKKRASIEDLLNHPYLTAEVKTVKKNVELEGDLENVVAQIQSLTPHRMSAVTQYLKKLSSQNNC